MTNVLYEALKAMPSSPERDALIDKVYNGARENLRAKGLTRISDLPDWKLNALIGTLKMQEEAPKQTPADRSWSIAICLEMLVGYLECRNEEDIVKFKAEMVVKLATM